MKLEKKSLCGLVKRAKIKTGPTFHSFNYYCNGNVRECYYGVKVENVPYCFYDLALNKPLRKKG